MNQSGQFNDRPNIQYILKCHKWTKIQIKWYILFCVQQTIQFRSIMRSTFDECALKCSLLYKILFDETRLQTTKKKILSRFVAIETLHFHLKIILVYRYFRVSKSCRKTKTKYNQQKQHPENQMLLFIACDALSLLPSSQKTPKTYITWIIHILFSRSQMLFCLMRVSLYSLPSSRYCCFCKMIVSESQKFSSACYCCVSCIIPHYIAQMTSFREIDICSQFLVVGHQAHSFSSCSINRFFPFLKLKKMTLRFVKCFFLLLCIFLPKRRNIFIHIWMTMQI